MLRVVDEPAGELIGSAQMLGANEAHIAVTTTDRGRVIRLVARQSVATHVIGIDSPASSDQSVPS